MGMIDVNEAFEKWWQEQYAVAIEFRDAQQCDYLIDGKDDMKSGFLAAANLYRERLEEAEKVIEFYGDTKRYQRAHHFHAALVIDDEGDIENIDSYRGNLTWTVAGKTARQYLSKYQTSEGK